jgi:disulfide oxidoreductase YuzD
MSLMPTPVHLMTVNYMSLLSEITAPPLITSCVIHPATVKDMPEFLHHIIRRNPDQSTHYTPIAITNSFRNSCLVLCSEEE